MASTDATTDAGTRTGGSAPAGASIVPQGPARLALIAITVAVLAQTLRFSLSQLDHLAGDAGIGAAGAAVLVIYLAGFAAPLIRRTAGPRGLLLIGVGGLFLVRLLAQALTPQTWLALVGTAIGMIAVAGLYEGARGLSGVGFATATVAGLAADGAVRMAFATWDPVWRSGIGPWAVCLAFVGLGAAALYRELVSGPVTAPGVSWRDAFGAAAFGPFLALQVLVLSSPAFVASSGWQSLTAAHIIVVVGQGLALAFLASGLAVRAVPGGVCVLGGTVLGVGAGAIAGTYAVSGVEVVPVVIVGQVLSAWLLAVACRAPLRRAGAGGPVWRVDVAAATGGLLVALILIPYQVSAIEPLPLPNNVLPGLAGILLGALAAIAAARGGPLPARAPLRALTAGAAALVLLLGTLVFTVAAPSGSAKAGPAPGHVRLLSYNIHDAVNQKGRLDPEDIARTIEGQRAQVVLLQEAGRGSLLSGTTDVAVWLSRRLGMKLLWGPAADGQFGNAILTSLPVRRSGTGRMPKGDWSQIRGYVWARLAVGSTTMDVWSTNLEGGSDHGDERSREVAALLRAWGGAPRTIIGGDFNASSDSPEIGRMLDSEMRSAALGGDASPTRADGTRNDWIFGTDDLLFADYEVPRSQASDHYPVAVTVRIGQ
ncbi:MULTISPECIES: endonuclease/exonuclease/phosphatase family protein [Thermomonosporaceae]|uniref:endonuclease/exonuclease/phosphatase family protein n=1 Tax=Thermomonosporaceae TaxID=2012 RepID=UPI00255AD863|nr:MULTISPECIES: endonuclease/exonuclease/phosphatase family protein [Thermomonosporaceae]MDL4770928.1 endonuclease/exonuclease/phosphatase [Actinomadura xylanilytica]